MKNFFRAAFVCTVLTSCIVNSTYLFKATLSPISGVVSPGIGQLDASTQDNNSRLSVNGSYSTLTSSPISIKIVSPTRNCTMDVYPDTSVSGRFAGFCEGPATNDDINNVNNGLTKVIIYTINNPEGELSGVIQRLN